MTSTSPLLFQPLTIAGVTLRNRVVIPPMCQYSAVDGMAQDWHLVHLGGFASGGAGLVIMEATGVSPEGRITHGCVGIWSDAHAEALAPSVRYMKARGAVPGIQIGHAGRKAATQRPWHGMGALDETDAARGEHPWDVVAPSAVPLADDWLTPKAMDAADMARVRTAFADAARRADAVGFEALEIHSAHGYLLQTFLSPLGNFRNDAYGGDRQGRMRFPLEVVDAVRAVWPEHKPLFVRISSVDGIEGGWDLEDSVAYALELKARGVDVIDCSSGGQSAQGATNARTSVPRGPGFQVPFAEHIRRETGIMTMAVGLIREAAHAEQILQEGRADLIAIGREALFDPFWARHAAAELGADEAFADWPEQYGWWLDKRAQSMKRPA